MKTLSCEKTRSRLVAALFVLAVACIALAGVGAASAYFTTYCQAKGGYTLELGDTTTVKEEFANWTKSVTVTSDAASDEAVYVRVKAYGPSEYPIQYGEPDGAANWKLAADGYYYYGGLLEPGATTTALNLRIEGVPTSSAGAGAGSGASGAGAGAAGPQPGDAFNVVVVYETTPAQYLPSGAAKQAEDADWSVKLETGQADAGRAADADATSEGGER